MHSHRYDHNNSLEEIVSSQEGKEEYGQLIANLKMKNKIVEDALFTAESLIESYKRENEELRASNSFLLEKISYLDKELSQYYQLLQSKWQSDEESNVNEKMKILELQQEKAEEKIKRIQHQLGKQRDKVGRKEREKVEKQLGNYFVFPSSPPSDTELKEEVKRLKWELKKRNEEVMLILRRSKRIEDKYLCLMEENQKRGQEKFLTCSTQPYQRTTH